MAVEYSAPSRRPAGGVSGAFAVNLTWQPHHQRVDIVTTTNWLNGAINDYYFDGDNVNFTSSGSSISPVLNTNVHPGSVTFNSANPYTLSGTRLINGIPARPRRTPAH